MTTTQSSSDQRLAQINSAFNSPEFQNQLNKWEEQRALLRKIVCEFWKNHQNQFQEYWKKTDFDVRTALILTAFEDLPDLEILSGTMPLCCPELLELHNLIEEPSKLIEIFQLVTSGKENHTPSNMNLSLIENEELNSDLAQPPLAKMSLKLLRSCILLQFCNAISLIYQQEQTQS